MTFTAPSADAVVTFAKSADPAMPNSTFLAFHIATRLEGAGQLIDVQSSEVRVSGRLGGINDAEADSERHHHGAEQTPSLLFVADHAAECIGQSAE